MKAETLADYRTRIADRTLITLSVVSIERILDERLRLLSALHRLYDYNESEGDVHGPAGCEAMDEVRAALEYANEPVP